MYSGFLGSFYEGGPRQSARHLPGTVISAISGEPANERGKQTSENERDTLLMVRNGGMDLRTWYSALRKEKSCWSLVMLHS